MMTYLSLIPGCTVIEGAGAGSASFVHRSDGTHFRLSPSSRRIVEELSQGISLEVICKRIVASSEALSSEALKAHLLLSYKPFMMPRENLAQIPVQYQQFAPAKPFLVNSTLISCTAVNSVTVHTSWLCGRRSVCWNIVLVCLAHFAFYHDVLYPTYKGPAHAGSAAAVLLVIVSVIWHEIGHASALKRHGATPGRIGVGFYLLMPVVYADVSPVWRLPQRARMDVDLAGIYFQQLLFIIYAIIALSTHNIIFRTACISIDVMTAIALNPAFRFDGYWFLVDWFDVPDLNRRAQSYLRALLAIIVFHSTTSLNRHIPSHLIRFRRYSFIAHATCANLFLGAVFILNARSIVRFAHQAIISVPLQGRAIWYAANTHDAVSFTYTLACLWFTVALVCTPFIAALLYLRLLSHRYSSSGRLFPDLMN